MHFTELVTCDSTQSYCKRLIDEHKSLGPFAVSCVNQDRGYGQNLSSWQSFAGNLHLSLCLQNQCLKPQLMTPIIGLACHKSVEQFCPDPSILKLKLVNDLFLNHKKYGGIICEVYKQHLIIGVGINLVKSPQGFESTNLLENSISIDRRELELEIVELIPKYISAYLTYGGRGLYGQIRKVLYQHKMSTINGITGYPVDITEEGEIVMSQLPLNSF